MDKDDAAEVIGYLSKVATGLHADTNAPFVIILCLGGLDRGTILSAAFGPTGPEDMRKALQRAIDSLDSGAAEHLVVSDRKLDS